MLSFKEVHFVLGSSIKRKCLCSPTVLATQSRRGLLPFKDIPRAPSLPIVKNIPYIIMAGGETKKHLYFDSLHKKLGPIFIDRTVGRELVFIADPRATLKMFDAEGKFPRHLLHPLWTTHINHQNIKRGLLFMDGQEWKDSREACEFMINFMYTDEQEREITSITQELMDIWRKNPPKNLKYHLYTWNLECAGVTVLGRRYGFLEKLRCFNKYDKKHLEEDKLIKSAFHFDDTFDLYFSVSIRKILNTPSWKNYKKFAGIELGTVSKYVEQAVQECLSEKPSEMSKRSVLYRLIDEGALDIETIKRIITDMVVSSAFSVSNAGAWALYILGRHPEIAEKVRQQVISAAAEGDLKVNFLETKVPLINGTLKESLRLFPTAPQLNRIITHNTELYGYSIPNGSIVISSMYTMGRDPKNFSYPLSFIPERWSKENIISHTITKNHVAGAFFPFSHRMRNCVGRRLAQADLKLLMVEALKSYEWTNDEVGTMTTYVLAPSEPIELRLKPYRN